MKLVSTWVSDIKDKRWYKCLCREISELKSLEEQHHTHLKTVLLEAIYFAKNTEKLKDKRLDTAKQEQQYKDKHLDNCIEAAQILSDLLNQNENKTQMRLNNEICFDTHVNLREKGFSITDNKSDHTSYTDSIEQSFEAFKEALEKRKHKAHLIGSYYCLKYQKSRPIKEIKNQVTVDTALTLYTAHTINKLISGKRGNIHGEAIALINGQFKNLAFAAKIIAIAMYETPNPTVKDITKLTENVKSIKKSNPDIRIRAWGVLSEW
jgi:hypothetical protein